MLCSTDAMVGWELDRDYTQGREEDAGTARRPIIVRFLEHDKQTSFDVYFRNPLLGDFAVMSYKEMLT